MELIWGLIGFASGGIFGFFGMAILSGRAYERGAHDGAFTAYYEGQEEGYRMALHDLTVAERAADEVVFTSKTENEGD